MDRMCNCNTESVSTSARDWETEYKKLVERDYSAAAKMSERLSETEKCCEDLKAENKVLIKRIESLTKEKDELIRENKFYETAHDKIYHDLQYQKGLVDGLKYCMSGRHLP